MAGTRRARFKQDWQVTVLRVLDPQAVGEGERLLVEFLLKSLQFDPDACVTTNLLCSKELVSSKKP